MEDSLVVVIYNGSEYRYRANMILCGFWFGGVVGSLGLIGVVVPSKLY